MRVKPSPTMPPRMTMGDGGDCGAARPIEATFSSVTGGAGISKAMIDGLMATGGARLSGSGKVSGTTPSLAGAAASRGGGATTAKLGEGTPKETIDGVFPGAGGATWTNDEAAACPLVSAPSAKLSNNSRNGSLRTTLTLQRPGPMRGFAGLLQLSP